MRIDPDDLADTATCAACLHAMEPAGSLTAPYWLCPSCGAVALSS